MTKEILNDLIKQYEEEKDEEKRKQLCDFLAQEFLSYTEDREMEEWQKQIGKTIGPVVKIISAILEALNKIVEEEEQDDN